MFRYGSATYKAPVATVLDPNGKLSITLSYGKLLSRSQKIAYTLLNTNDLGLSLFGARSLNTLSTRPGYSHSDLTGAMCFLLYTNGDESKMECMAR